MTNDGNGETHIIEDYLEPTDIQQALVEELSEEQGVSKDEHLQTETICPTEQNIDMNEFWNYVLEKLKILDDYKPTENNSFLTIHIKTKVKITSITTCCAKHYKICCEVP